MPALEIIGGGATAPSSTLTEITMGDGNSKTIRSVSPDNIIRLLTCWTNNQSAGEFQINSPKLHDNIAALKFNSSALNPVPMLPLGINQRLFAQDTLSIKISGSGTAGDIENACLLIYYEDLPGSNGNFITFQEAVDRQVNLKTIDITISAGTAGGWSGAELINADENLLKANTFYAVLGAVNGTKVCAYRLRGTDFGNLGLGWPGHDAKYNVTANFFMELSFKTGLPTVPVFNSANVGSMYIDVLNNENAATPVVSLLLAELAT